MNVRERIRAVDKGLSRLPLPVVLAMAVVGVLVVGLVDFGTGYELSLSVLYVGPVAFATWYLGSRLGVVVSLLSSLVWVVADLSAGHLYSHGAIPYWNGVVRLGFFVITALLIGEVRVLLAIERRLSRTDPLTGALNARAFHEQLERELALSGRSGQMVTVAYVDLDNFKSVNDLLGHAEGDRLLRRIGEVLRGAVRRTDVVARLGGDEFAMVLPNTSREGAEEALAKVLQQLSSATSDTPLSVTCSVGAVVFSAGGMAADEAIRAADEVMYAVKRRGKDGLEVVMASRVSDEEARRSE